MSQNREKTNFRHVNAEGKIIRVTKMGDAFYIGDTMERAEGKMAHYNQTKNSNRAHPVRSKNRRPDYANNNPYYGSGNGEMDDYAHTSEDL